jgi:hypothetical protein
MICPQIAVSYRTAAELASGNNAIRNIRAYSQEQQKTAAGFAVLAIADRLRRRLSAENRLRSLKIRWKYSKNTKERNIPTARST